MNNNKANLKSVKKLRLDQLEKQLIEGDVNGAKENLTWLDATEKFQNSYKFKWLPYLIGFGCLMLLGLSMLPLPTTAGQLDILAEEIKVAYYDIPSLHFRTSSLGINSVQRVHLLGQSMPLDSRRRNELKWEANQVDLSIFPTTAASQQVGVQRVDDFILLKFYVDSLEMQIDFSQGILEVLPENYSYEATGQVPETMEVTAIPGGGPIQITLLDTSGINFPSIMAHKISFETTRTTSLSSSTIKSSIKSGDIKLPSTGDEYEVGENEFLFLQPFGLTRIDLEDEGTGIRAIAEGSFKRMIKGYESYQESLKPSFLVYLIKNNQIALYWSSLAWIWGMFWSIKRIL